MVPVKEKGLTQTLNVALPLGSPALQFVDPNGGTCYADRYGRHSVVTCAGELMEEHRAAQRRRVLKAGTISFGGGGAISCTVRNLSGTGAALDVESPVGIPDLLTLSIEAEQGSRHCKVVWRKEKKIGVRFVPD